MCFSSFLSNVGAIALKPSTCISAGMLPAMLSPSAKMTPQELTPGSALALATASFASNWGTAAVTGASTGANIATRADCVFGHATLGSSAGSLFTCDSSAGLFTILLGYGASGATFGVTYIVH